jgi:hypothetical protein
MAIQIFIAHSVAPRELAAVSVVADTTASKGAVPIISLRNWDPKLMPPGVKTQIDSSNYVIAIVTRYGRQLDWVNAEIAYSQEVGRPILIVADEGIPIPPQYNIIRINRSEALRTLSAVSRKIQEWVDDEETKKLLRGLVVGGLVLLFLTSSKGE